MKIIKIFLTAILASTLVVSCEVEDGSDLNGPSIESISSDLSRGELQDAIGGILADMRTRIGTQVDAQSVAGREYWRFQSSDPRWTADLLTGTLDNNTFYTTAPYSSRYATVKEVNLVLQGLTNSTESFSDAEKAGIRGFVNTIKAHELLMVLNLQFQNGIRIDVADGDNLGPFVEYSNALQEIFTLLQNAATDLANAGDAFAFNLPSGFDGIEDAGDTPDDPDEDNNVVSPNDFITFNNALAARVAAYRGDYTAADALLTSSFMNLTGDVTNGVYMTFSLSGTDIANPLFFATNSTGANARIVHPSFITDADAGDTRVNKAVFRQAANTSGVVEPNPLTQDNLTGGYDVFIYDSNTAPVAIVRNEELILLYAEANHISDPAEAVNAINAVRTAASLGPYMGGTTPAELVTEILKQRRYSLFAEGGHRWIDLRRFNRLNELPLDRAGDATFEQFPTPANENR
ncbi:RagB/SusD family nutrient uptake outer membrane protein [Aquimarina mytili]|uniref:RagB/SusD family nutrient uptake outer membrane protein n=1 Tax=Aquimarina mytili TaxID=874423 RepID=A0A937D9K3_9FLAO|nr:RagB/SusD family nutrient uptake outer membrane protein [Aquimarina mytili]MBL0683802.1 RagB/SusD family nutrient uptake outer membrane protein [Aquimarina mytili]